MAPHLASIDTKSFLMWKVTQEASLPQRQKWYYLTHNFGKRELAPFPWVSPKVNVIARLEFELAYYNVTIQHVSHYTTWPAPSFMMIAWGLDILLRWVKSFGIFWYLLVCTIYITWPKLWEVTTVVDNIMINGTLTHCVPLYSVCDLKAA